MHKNGIRRPARCAGRFPMPSIGKGKKESKLFLAVCEEMCYNKMNYANRKHFMRLYRHEGVKENENKKDEQGHDVGYHAGRCDHGHGCTLHCGLLFLWPVVPGGFPVWTDPDGSFAGLPFGNRSLVRHHHPGVPDFPAVQQYLGICGHVGNVPDCRGIPGAGCRRRAGVPL